VCSIYIGAAIMGVGGCSIGRRALRAGNSASFSAFVLWVTAVVTLATIGISG